jgi:hypothetical protein
LAAISSTRLIEAESNGHLVGQETNNTIVKHNLACRTTSSNFSPRIPSNITMANLRQVIAETLSPYAEIRQKGK